MFVRLVCPTLPLICTAFTCRKNRTAAESTPLAFVICVHALFQGDFYDRLKHDIEQQKK